jgi:hypothetical protein
MTPQEIKHKSTQELVNFYNAHAKSSIKKFTDRATAEKRVATLIKELIDLPKLQSTKRSKSKRSMRFRFAPKPVKEQTKLRETSKSKKVFDLLSREKGALFTEIKEHFNWSSNNTYEAIRLIHFRTGVGLWHIEENGDLRIFTIIEYKEYVQLLNDSKEEDKKAA